MSSAEASAGLQSVGRRPAVRGRLAVPAFRLAPTRVGQALPLHRAGAGWFEAGARGHAPGGVRGSLSRDWGKRGSPVRQHGRARTTGQIAQRLSAAHGRPGSMQGKFWPQARRAQRKCVKGKASRKSGGLLGHFVNFTPRLHTRPPRRSPDLCSNGGVVTGRKSGLRGGGSVFKPIYCSHRHSGFVSPEQRELPYADWPSAYFQTTVLNRCLNSRPVRGACDASLSSLASSGAFFWRVLLLSECKNQFVLHNRKA